MIRRLLALTFVFGSLLGIAGSEPRVAETGAVYWPQFRGPGGLAVAPDTQKLPVEFGSSSNLLWKTPLPRGHSSPCVWGDRIFLTGFLEPSRRLATLCIDRRDGHVLWQKIAPTRKVEHGHQISTPANSTPVTDGQRVYVYFGSFGLLCYDLNGNEAWKKPLPMPTTIFGTATSPVLGGGLLLLNCDHAPKPYLLAVNPGTGETVWSQERLPFREGYATPFIWSHDGVDEIIVHSSARLAAHQPKDGALTWWIDLSAVACSTPTSDGGRLFTAVWAHGGEVEDRVPIPEFDPFLEQQDKNHDGKIGQDEIPPDMLILRRTEAAGIPGAEIKFGWVFSVVDQNRDGQLDREEWEAARHLGEKTEHGLLAIKPGGRGDVSATHLLWRERQGVPEVPSPVAYQGRVYMVRDGGVVSCLDAGTGRRIYRERLGAGGAYFSSPVAGDGKLFAASESGVVTVFAAGDTFRVLARNDLEEPILATPALLDGKIYVRTERHLYAFGSS